CHHSAMGKYGSPHSNNIFGIRSFIAVKHLTLNTQLSFFTFSSNSSGTSIFMRSRCEAWVFPCASSLSDTVPPPPKLSYSTKLNAPIFGNSYRSTFHLQIVFIYSFTTSAVSFSFKKGYTSGCRAIIPTLLWFPLSPLRP